MRTINIIIVLLFTVMLGTNTTALVSSEDVQKKTAAAGHDTEKFAADNKAYAKLDTCCKYQRKGNEQIK